jgi:hypothetical protein
MSSSCTQPDHVLADIPESATDREADQTVPTDPGGRRIPSRQSRRADR